MDASPHPTMRSHQKKLVDKPAQRWFFAQGERFPIAGRGRVGRALGPYVAGRNDVPNTGATGLGGLRPPHCGTQRYPNPIPRKPP